MAVQQLNVKIGADVGGAVTGINQVNQALGKTQQATQKTGKDFTGLSRVIQDLPYGFNGISNNLTQLLPAAGAAGLAISAITTAITFATIGFGAWTRGIGGASKSTEEAAKALEEYRAMVKGVASDIGESASRVTSLYVALKSGNLTTAETTSALKELKEINKDYFGQLQQEEGIVKGLDSAYQGYIKAIQEIGKTKAIEAQLTKAFSRKLELELAIDPKFVSATSSGVQKVVGELQKKLDALGGALSKETKEAFEAKPFDPFAAESEASKNVRLRIQYMRQIAELQKGSVVTFQTGSIRAANSELEELDLTIRGLINLLGTSHKTDIDIADPKKLKEAKAILEDFKFRFDLLGPLNADKTITDMFKNINDAVKAADAPSEFEKSFQTKLKKSLEKPIPARINIVPVLPPDIETDAEKLGAEMQSIIQNAIAPAFINFGESIGAAIAAGENPIEAAGKSILGSLGDLISQIGKALIEYGVQKEILDKIIIGGFAIPGAAAIVAGVAAVAVGALVKNSFKPKKMAEGALVFGQTFAEIGEGRGTTRSNPEVVAPLDKLKKFIGGGQQFPDYLPSFQLSGDTLRLWYARANKNGGMFG